MPGPEAEPAHRMPHRSREASTVTPCRRVGDLSTPGGGTSRITCGTMALAALETLTAGGPGALRGGRAGPA
jgi:hypothetical protein